MYLLGTGLDEVTPHRQLILPKCNMEEDELREILELLLWQKHKVLKTYISNWTSFFLQVPWYEWNASFCCLVKVHRSGNENCNCLYQRSRQQLLRIQAVKTLQNCCHQVVHLIICRVFVILQKSPDQGFQKVEHPHCSAINIRKGVAFAKGWQQSKHGFLPFWKTWHEQQKRTSSTTPVWSLPLIIELPHPPRVIWPV